MNIIQAWKNYRDHGNRDPEIFRNNPMPGSVYSSERPSPRGELMSGLVTGGRDPNEDEWKQSHAAVKDGDGLISVGEASVTKPEIIKFNLSGPGSEYWGHWKEAGGDHTAYVKENVPTFALVGALLLTQSLAMAWFYFFLYLG
jgi:hypothetical protein